MLAVLDATGTDRAVLVGFSCGVAWSVHVAAGHPERVSGIVAISPSCGLSIASPGREKYAFDARLDTTRGWAKYNEHYWRSGGYEDFVQFFSGQTFHEPHSTKQVEDFVAWGRNVSADTLADTTAGRLGLHGAEAAPLEPLCAEVTCPVLVVHGTEDHVRPAAIARRLADLTGGDLVLLEGVGHGPPGREPVRINHLVKEFADMVHPSSSTRTWVRAQRRPRRALYLSSPIGLGHARRDLAIAAELRERHPDLQVDWLAQDPVTRVLAASGETVHPASRFLASESAHIEDECAEHDLHAFQAIRRMDEILVANFMLFLDVVREENYDLWIGDEAWEVDYFLHENPELKSAAYVWLTDFVGWLPFEDGGEHETFLTTDYNAEMIEHIARFPRIRDRAVFVGNPDDVIPNSFGNGLPGIRDWTEQHYDFSGYVTGFEPVADREKLRSELGYGPREQVCIVTVGGSGVGGHLLRRVIDAFPQAKANVPGLRMVVVAGPRIDPASLPQHDGLEIHPYVHELYRHLAACDLAVVQGGLTTSMELTANRRPFLYFPLRHHFEQNHHVRHRLGRYGAGRCMDFETDGPSEIAAAIAEEIGREV